MILKPQTIKISENFKVPTRTLTITKENARALNNRILQDMEQNEREREAGRVIAARCRMK